MGGTKRSLGLIRRVAMPALALIVVGTFAGHAVAGANGLLAWGGYHRALKERQVELTKLQQEKAQLRHRSALLDPRKADPDMADELVRKDLGLVARAKGAVPLADARGAPFPPTRAVAANPCFSYSPGRLSRREVLVARSAKPDAVSPAAEPPSIERPPQPGR